RVYETTERDLLRVNGAENGFVLSFGTAVNFLRMYYAREKQGTFQATLLLTRLILSALSGTHSARAVFQATGADVEVDGAPIPFRQFTFFFAATVDRIALGFRPTYLGARKPGYFHVLGGPIRAVRLIRRVVRIYRGFPTGEPELFDNLARRLAIRFFKSEHYMIDGDILPPAERLAVDVACRVTLIRGWDRPETRSRVGLIRAAELGEVPARDPLGPHPDHHPLARLPAHRLAQPLCRPRRLVLGVHPREHVEHVLDVPVERRPAADEEPLQLGIGPPALHEKRAARVAAQVHGLL